MFDDLSGAALAAALAEVELWSLDARGALQYACAMRRVTAWSTAGEADGLAHLVEHYEPVDDQARELTAEVRAAYGCSSRTASARLSWAYRLQDVPATRAALRDGRVDVAQAWVVMDTVDLLREPADQRELEQRVLAAHAAAPAGMALHQWRRLAARTALELDPTAGEQRRCRTRTDRGVWHRPMDDTRGELVLEGPVESTLACEAAVDARARSWRSEGRSGTLDQLRYDAAVELLTTSPDGRVPAGAPLLAITVPLSSVVGDDDAPGELAGAGAVPASLARELAGAAPVWERLLTDPSDGHLVVQDVRRYRPTEAQRRFLLARSPTCHARSCTARRGLQIDHVEPAPEGPTSVANLDPLCGVDHEAKTTQAWAHALDPGTGELVQISPLGRVYRTAPPLPPGPTGVVAEPHECDVGPPLVGRDEDGDRVGVQGGAADGDGRWLEARAAVPVAMEEVMARLNAEDREWLAELGYDPSDLDDPACADAREACLRY